MPRIPRDALGRAERDERHCGGSGIGPLRRNGCAARQCRESGGDTGVFRVSLPSVPVAASEPDETRAPRNVPESKEEFNILADVFAGDLGDLLWG